MGNGGHIRQNLTVYGLLAIITVPLIVGIWYAHTSVERNKISRGNHTLVSKRDVVNKDILVRVMFYIRIMISTPIYKPSIACIIFFSILVSMIYSDTEIEDLVYKMFDTRQCENSYAG